MFSSTGRRVFYGGFRTCRRLFTSGDAKNPKNIYGFFDDRTLGLLTLLVSVPTVRNLTSKHVGPLIFIGCLHLEASQIF